MISRKVLSVIVPTYNMERLLSHCLDSLLVQRNRAGLEVIIVNDGSTDCSLEIATGYASRFPDIYRVIDKKNGNYGSCINAALPVATGKYVKVIDADDSVDTSNFDAFIDFLEENDVDLALSDFTWVDPDHNKLKDTTYPLGRDVLSMDEACVQEAFKNMEMHAVTYRRQMLTDAGYRQTEGISYTDQQWIFAPMAYVRTMGVFHRPVYLYMVGRAGQTIDPEVKLRKTRDRVSYVMGMIRKYDTLCSGASREIQGYLDARIYPNIKDIYITYFTHHNETDRQALLTFDSEFLTASEALYHQLERSSLHIKLWRSIKGNKAVDNLFCTIFTIILYLKTWKR